MHCNWKQTDAAKLRSRVQAPALIAPILGFLIPWLLYGVPSFLTFLGVSAASWIMLVSAWPIVRSIIRQTSLGGRAVLGMHVAHFGLGVFVMGATVVSAFSIETDQTIEVGSTVTVGDVDFTLRTLRNVSGPNYEALEGEFELRRDGKLIGLLNPQKRTYRVQKSPMTEAGIDAKLSRDWFVALGDPLGGQSWSARIQYKPMLRLIWLGALIMALGGVLALSDKRYSRRVRRSEGIAVDVKSGGTAIDTLAEARP